MARTRLVLARVGSALFSLMALALAFRTEQVWWAWLGLVGLICFGFLLWLSVPLI